MNLQTASTTGTNGESSIQDLFALSDEQILEIAPEAEVTGQQDSVAPAERTSLNADGNAGVATQPSVTSHQSPVSNNQATDQGTSAQPRLAVPLEPPPWLAAQMKDPWSGPEAEEFWNGVQQARTEAAAYRAAFATPEDARALKELYPGGVSEARAAAERGRLLEEIDRAYFGAAGNSPEQTSTSRAQLAQRMLREDPAAFREMVAAGLQALQEVEQGSGAATNAASLPRLAQVFAESRSNREAASRFAIGTPSAAGSQPTPSDAGLKPGAAFLGPGAGAQHAAPLPGNTPFGGAHVAAYAAFARAANEDLERSVGGAIERTLAQALPSFEQHNTPGQVRLGELAGAQQAAPLRERLAASVRADVEKALQGDRQLGEQVAQILSSRRFDNDARAQVVRLIADRAQQLVPGAAKRVLNEWTQTTLAAHRGRTHRADAASARADVAPASGPARPGGDEQRHASRQSATRSSAQVDPARSRQINYRKLSDEQILDL